MNRIVAGIDADKAAYITAGLAVILIALLYLVGMAPLVATVVAFLFLADLFALAAAGLVVLLQSV